MARVLIISNDAIGAKMAGPGIRIWELAKLLSLEHDVTLLCPTRTEFRHPKLTLGLATNKSVQTSAGTHDIVICQDRTMWHYSLLLEHPIIKVIDLYDPPTIGALEARPVGSLRTQMKFHHVLIRDYYGSLRGGDFFLCANERQRDFWIGMLMAAGRVNPAVYRDDRMIGNLLAIVPFGIPANPPVHRKCVLKGVWPGIGRDDVVVIWGGGLWEWFDPLSAVEAMSLVQQKRADIKLFFMGVKRPNASVISSHMADQTIALANQMGLVDRSVFFNDWVPYEERESFLLEADLGLNSHRQGLETRFSFRTRMMDYLWAGLPIITTEGDMLSDLVRQNRLGVIVPCGNPRLLAEAIVQAADDSESRRVWKQNCLVTAEQFTWDRVFKPVLEFCRAPRPAKDKEYASMWPGNTLRPSKRPWAYYLQRARYYYHAGGVLGLAAQTFRWWWRRR